MRMLPGRLRRADNNVKPQARKKHDHAAMMHNAPGLIFDF